MVLKLGHFGEYINNTRKVFKCGAREGWRRSVKTNGVKNAVLHRVKKERIVYTIKRVQASWYGHVLLRTCLLKHGTEGR
jgi:hypothetical protein